MGEGDEEEQAVFLFDEARQHQPTSRSRAAVAVVGGERLEFEGSLGLAVGAAVEREEGGRGKRRRISDAGGVCVGAQRGSQRGVDYSLARKKVVPSRLYLVINNVDGEEVKKRTTRGRGGGRVLFGFLTILFLCNREVIWWWQ